jgi:Dual OB-containing domain
MPYSRTILCLAKSRKPGGLCFAGKDLATGEWIRPVSDRPGEAISSAECRTSDSSSAQLLDMLEIPFLRANPHRHQTENHLIDSARRWRRRRTGTWRDVEAALDKHAGPLWFNERGSWGYSWNRVRESVLPRLKGSLLLIRPAKLAIAVAPKGGDYDDAGKRVVKASFSHTGIDYRLSVTDPVVERHMRAGADRTVDMTGAAICVSLGDLYDGFAYKLVAGVMRP